MKTQMQRLAPGDPEPPEYDEDDDDRDAWSDEQELRQLLGLPEITMQEFRCHRQQV